MEALRAGGGSTAACDKIERLALKTWGTGMVSLLASPLGEMTVTVGRDMSSFGCVVSTLCWCCKSAVADSFSVCGLPRLHLLSVLSESPLSHLGRANSATPTCNIQTCFMMWRTLGLVIFNKLVG